MLLVPLLAGCAELVSQVQESQVQERGACTLDVVTERIIHSNPPGPDGMVQLEAPYVVTLRQDVVDFPPAAYVRLEGHGWPNPEGTREGDSPGWITALVVAPDGTKSVIPTGARDILIVEHALDRPGMWTFLVEEQLGDCRQTVSVEVLPLQ